MAATDFAKSEPQFIRLYGHVLEMNTHRKGCERLNRFEWCLEQSKIVAGIDIDADPFATELAHERSEFVTGEVFVILHSEFQPMFLQDRLDPR